MTPNPGALQHVSALRTLCRRLPHLPTPLERELLARFDTLRASPEAATSEDAQAIAAGWTRWWRRADIEAIHDMAKRLSPDVVQEHRPLVTLRMAARQVLWARTQDSIWRCDVCVGQPRVEVNVRQQTDAWHGDHVKLLVVSLAPPFRPATRRAAALSATNDTQDGLRLFVEESLGRRWADLALGGFALAHAVKCAIIPDLDGFQNPPRNVIDECAPRHLAAEIRLLAPEVIVTLGDMAYRAVVRSLTDATQTARGPLRLTRYPAAGAAILAGGIRFRLFAGPFIRGPHRRQAAAVLREAAVASGL